MKILIKTKKTLHEQAVSIVREYVDPDAPIEIIGDEEDFSINLFDATLAQAQVTEIKLRMQKIYAENGRVMSFESQGTSNR